MHSPETATDDGSPETVADDLPESWLAREDVWSFLGIEAGRAVVDEAVRQQAVLAALGADCVPRPYLHLTLDDLGEVPAEALEAAALACDRVLDRCPPFTVRVAGICAFPSPAAPRIVGLNVVDHRDRLAQLRATLHEALKAYGFALDPRRFWPHIALGRLPEGAPPLDGSRFVVNEVSLKVREVLVISRRTAGGLGPAWQVRHHLPLRAQAVRPESTSDPDAERAAIAAELAERLAARAQPAQAPAPATRRRQGRR